MFTKIFFRNISDENIFGANIFSKIIFGINIFGENIFGINIFVGNIFGKNIFFLPFPHLTALQTTPTSSVIFEVEFYGQRTNLPCTKGGKYKYR